MYRKSLEGKERILYEKKRMIKEALQGLLLFFQFLLTLSHSYIHECMKAFVFMVFLRWVLIVGVNFVGIGVYFFVREKTDSNGVEKRGGRASAPNQP